MVDFQWLIGGEAGYGIMTVGALMGKVFTRLGLSVFDYTEYPSLIRGGHNAYYVRASDEEIFCQKQAVDILVALNRETIDRHKHELTPTALVVYDPNVTKIEEAEFSTQTLIPIPLLELTKQVGADRLMINTVSVGASLALLYNDFTVLEGLLKDIFGRKGESVVSLNVNTSKAGFDYVVKNFAGKSKVTIQKKPQENLFIGGAESLALGAIRAGVKFAAIYPMTPINAVLTTISAYALKYNIIVKEPEDEIAGVNMAIGASFAGVRSIAATSGGGFALMVEGLGLAAQTETPLVVIEGMRPGPATGMPTWTDQGDVRFVLHAAHGDFPRIVVAPGDCLEAFETVMEAFNLAEKYQMLVIVLTDKYLNEGHATVSTEKFKTQNSNYQIERGKMLTDEEVLKEADYKRYLLTDDGISPRSIPGQQNGIALNGSDEHDEKGLYNETSDMRIKMMDKRFKKLDMVAKVLPPPVIYGDKDAVLTIVGFGSTKLPVLEAIKWLKKEGIVVNFLQVMYLNPFPIDAVTNILKSAKKTLVIEGNKTGQFESVIQEKTGFVFTNHFRKYDGRPFYPEEIVATVKTLLK